MSDVSDMHVYLQSIYHNICVVHILQVF